MRDPRELRNEPLETKVRELREYLTQRVLSTQEAQLGEARVKQSAALGARTTTLYQVLEFLDLADM